jgi:hypothetical protein
LYQRSPQPEKEKVLKDGKGDKEGTDWDTLLSNKPMDDPVLFEAFDSATNVDWQEIRSLGRKEVENARWGYELYLMNKERIAFENDLRAKGLAGSDLDQTQEEGKCSYID